MYEVKEKIENIMYEINGKQVMLDSDLARLYEVYTKKKLKLYKKIKKSFLNCFVLEL